MFRLKANKALRRGPGGQGKDRETRRRAVRENHLCGVWPPPVWDPV